MSGSLRFWTKARAGGRNLLAMDRLQQVVATDPKFSTYFGKQIIYKNSQTGRVRLWNTLKYVLVIQ